MSENAYSLPEIYDIAFGFRDFSRAVDFLYQASANAGMTDITSMVEFCCGPGQYCREFSRRNITAYGIDLSNEMVLYAQKLIAEEKLSCEIVEDDIRTFRLPQKVDLAICMMASFHLLLTNDDIITHLNSVADNLVEGGLYIIEMSHPRQMFEKVSESQINWEMKRNGITVHTVWGSDGITDPLTEIVTGTVSYTITKDNAIRLYSFREKWREISLGLMRALIELSGRFKIAAMYGDIDINIPFDNAHKAWRMVLVLRKYE